ncbi:MAG: polysaccharide biosynthesis C-terminal domain-containing protein, partial [Caldisericia bacterium]|nr:polysaccharide biosynthesis C-terminal domain-containing protein [Caldisericia bacterium]
RVLGPSGKGALSLILLIPNFIFLLMSLSIHQANIYFIGQYKNKLPNIISNTIIFVTVTGGLLAILEWVLRSKIGSWFSLEAYKSALTWSVFLFPLVFAYKFYVNILIGQKHFMKRNIAYIIENSSRLCLVILFVYFWNEDVLGAVKASIIALLLATLYSFVKIIKDKYFFLIKPDLDLFKKTLSFGLKSYLGNITQIFNYRLDMFLVNHFLGVSAVGIYSIAVSVGELLWYIPMSIGNILFPIVSSNSEEYGDKYISSVVRKTILLTLAGALGILLAGWFLIPFLFGNKFISSVKPLIILLPGTIAISIHKVLVFALMGKGYPEYLSYSSVIAFIITIGLDLVFIPLIGVSGAALASTIAYVICLIFTMHWYRKTTTLSLTKIIIPHRDDFRYFWNYGNRVIKKIFG